MAVLVRIRTKRTRLVVNHVGIESVHDATYEYIVGTRIAVPTHRIQLGLFRELASWRGYASNVDCAIVDSVDLLRRLFCASPLP